MEHDSGPGRGTADETDTRGRGGARDAEFALRPPRDWHIAIGRTEVVREFLDLEERSAEIADAYAARLGLSRSRFYDLARAFRTARDGLLEGHAALGAKRLDPAVEEVIAGAIQACGPAASHTDVWEAVLTLCGLRGVKPPSRPTLRARVAAAWAQSTGAPSSKGPSLRIDEADLGLAVRAAEGQPVSPTLTALVNVDDGRVLGHSLGLEMSATERARKAAANALAVWKPQGRADAGELAQRIVDRLIDNEAPPRSRGRILLRLLGLKLGSIPLRPRKLRHEFRDDHGPVVELDAACEAVSRLLAIHNGKRAGAPASALDVDRLLARLLDGTEVLVDAPCPDESIDGEAGHE